MPCAMVTRTYIRLGDQEGPKEVGKKLLNFNLLDSAHLLSSISHHPLQLQQYQFVVLQIYHVISQFCAFIPAILCCAYKYLLLLCHCLPSSALQRQHSYIHSPNSGQNAGIPKRRSLLCAINMFQSTHIPQLYLICFTILSPTK